MRWIKKKRFEEDALSHLSEGKIIVYRDDLSHNCALSVLKL